MVNDKIDLVGIILTIKLINDRTGQNTNSSLEVRL